MKADQVLLDERKATLVARRLGLAVTGTLMTATVASLVPDGASWPLEFETGLQRRLVRVGGRLVLSHYTARG